MALNGPGGRGLHPGPLLLQAGSNLPAHSKMMKQFSALA